MSLMTIGRRWAGLVAGLALAVFVADPTQVAAGLAESVSTNDRATSARARAELLAMLNRQWVELSASVAEARRQLPPASSTARASAWADPEHGPVSASLRETYVALAAVLVEEARDWLGDAIPPLGKAGPCLTRARSLLAELEPKKPASVARRDGFLEHGYFAANDDSPQPYFVHLPAGYDSTRRWPLVLLLHGWVPGTNRRVPWLVSEDIVAVAERHKVLLVVPHGRTNTDFQYAGEVDVLRVKREMERFYAVDPDRIYLLGVSMGGAGAWQIGAHYPDLFAGVAPINGQGDWFRFWHEHYGYPTRRALPTHLQWLMALNNPLDLAENFSALYSYSQHATRCFVGVAHTRDMVARLREVSAPHDFFEDPSELGHHIYWETACWDRAFLHLLKRVRTRAPREVRYATYAQRYHRAYWVDIEQFEAWGKRAAVRARCGDGGRLRVDSENVARLHLAPPPSWAGPDGTFDVAWNGTDLGSVRPDDKGRLTLTQPGVSAAPAEGLLKTATVCGPASDVFNYPFVAVIGTIGTAAESADSLALAEQFADDWFKYAEGRVRIVRDVDVTEAMLRDYGLILFGVPETHALVRRMAGRLPFRLSRTGVTLPDGRRYTGEDIGIVLTYPNPLAPRRYVLVYHGLPWGVARSTNHKFDYLPDFVIFTRRTVPRVAINEFLAAGLFDRNWRYDPTLTDFNVKQSTAADNPTTD